MKIEDAEKTQQKEYDRKVESNAIDYKSALMTDPTLTKEEFDNLQVLAKRNFERILKE